MHTMKDTEVVAQEESSIVFRNLGILQHIVLFVGNNQYRFVAAISKDFQSLYLSLFSQSKETNYNVSTVKHAKISMECPEVRFNSVLCNLAARCGSLPSLQFLKSQNFQWDANTTADAAMNGHFELLKWARAYIWLSMGYANLFQCSWEWPFRYTAMGSRRGLPVE
jgi:hypothetical protein